MKNIKFASAMMLLVSGALFSQMTSTPLAPGVIDGSQTPALIPDNLAYRFVFSSLMLPAAPTPASAQRQLSKLNNIGLTAINVTAMRGLMAQFGTQRGTWRSQVAANGAPTKVQAATFEAAMDAIVQQTRVLLAQQITPDGASKFLAYVQKAKGRMVVRP